MGGRIQLARQSYTAALAIAEQLNDKRAKAVDLDHLGSLALQEGNADEAISQFKMALRIFSDLGQRAPQAIARHHLGMAFQQKQRWKDAEREYVEAIGIFEDCGDLPGVAGCSSLLATVLESSARNEAAEEWYRKALFVARQSKNNAEIRRHLLGLARYLLGRQHAEVRAVLEEALARSGNSLDADVWTTYELLARALSAESVDVPDETRKSELLAQAASYRHIQEFGPRLLNTLASLGSERGFGRAVILERLARSCLVGGRPGTALLLFDEALAEIDEAVQRDSGVGLLGVIQSGIGDALQALGKKSEALRAFEESLAAARRLCDLRAQADLLEQLTTDDSIDKASMYCRDLVGVYEQLGEREQEATAREQLARLYEKAEQWDQAECQIANPADTDPTEDHCAETAEGCPPLKLTIRDEISVECVFGTDLLIDIRRECRVHHWTAAAAPLSDDSVLALSLGVRTWLDERGTCQFYMPPTEPQFETHSGCTVIRRQLREIVIFDSAELVGRLVRNLDGSRTVARILAEFAEGSRDAMTFLIAVLAANGAIDASGRSIARYLHSSTKKGVLPAGGLGSSEVLNLASDGNYRTYNVTRLALGSRIPDRLHSLHSLTRARRSRRDYNGALIPREDLDSLFHTACGVTGALPWQDREIKLRAYPSSGALYAVEIYPVIFGVSGLEPGVYHYVADCHSFEVVRHATQPDFVSATLPIERQMVSGAAAAICLVGRFKRHEQKYGQGGYRMMIAEAGHISQNLILSAVALGLDARPFGGVFDSLINDYLGLNDKEEQFLLSVLIGYAGPANAPSAVAPSGGDNEIEPQSSM